MKPWAHSAVLALTFVAIAAPAISGPARADDLREAIPTDMYLAIHGKHNPERDYQAQYYEDVWKAFEQSRIIERIGQIIQARMSDDDVAGMVAFRDAVKQALAPIEWKKLGGISEMVYGQRFEKYATQNVLILRCPDGSAASLAEGIGNLMAMADEKAGDHLNVVQDSHAGARISTLQLPPDVPYSLVIGVRDDLFIYSSSVDLAKQSLDLLDNPNSASKFEDPRIAEALQHLPAPEDALIFFDGKELFRQTRGLVDFIRQVAPESDDAQSFAGLLQNFLSDVEILDFEVTVEFTEGFRNQTAGYGKVVEGYKETLAGRMINDQHPFSDWDKWVPADASGFKLDSGANLHPLYDWVTTKLPEAFPGTEEIFDEFKTIQEQYDVHLDKDILQSFSGQSVSITLPGPMTPLGPSAKSVTFLRCQNPDRVRDLIHRGIEALQKIPQVRAQGLTIAESAQLDGFEEIRATPFVMMGGMTPVFGFRDGWLVFGTHTDAVQKVLLTRGGEAETIASSETFTQFGLDITGDVTDISYSNTGESIRQMSMGLQQVGAMLPMIMAMSGQQQGGPDLTPVQDILGLLPSVGRIIGKFDFIESKLNVTQPGPEANTWVSRSVTMIRPPANAKNAER